MSKVEEGGGGPIDPPPPSRLRLTIFSRRLLGLNVLLNDISNFNKINQ